MTTFHRGPSYLQLAALRDVLEGRRKRAHGIGTCGECGEAWITDGPFKACPDCRHLRVVHRRCDQCKAKYRLEFLGHVLCLSCREQLPLFP